MMNIWIRWHFGYWAYIDMKKLNLRRGNIYFYNDKGEVVYCRLEDSVQFDMRVNCAIKYTRSNVKLDYTKGIVFAVRHKGDEYDLYIPMSEVNFAKSHKNEQPYNDETMIRVTQCCGFDGSNLNFWNPNCNLNRFKTYHSTKGERVLFNLFIEAKETEKGKYIEKMSRTIREECGVTIDTYDMGKILEKFKFEKL